MKRDDTARILLAALVVAVVVGGCLTIQALERARRLNLQALAALRRIEERLANRPATGATLHPAAGKIANKEFFVPGAQVGGQDKDIGRVVRRFGYAGDSGVILQAVSTAENYCPASRDASLEQAFGISDVASEIWSVHDDIPAVTETDITCPLSDPLQPHDGNCVGAERRDNRITLSVNLQRKAS